MFKKFAKQLVLNFRGFLFIWVFFAMATELQYEMFFGEYTFFGVMLISFLLYASIIMIVNLWSHKWIAKTEQTQITMKKFDETNQISWKWMLIPLGILLGILVYTILTA